MNGPFGDVHFLVSFDCSELKESYSIRQLERVTGISRGVIQKC